MSGVVDRSAPVMIVKVYTEGGTSQRFDISDKVFSLTYDDEEKSASKVEIELDNYDLAFFDDPVLRKGNLVEFSYGYAGRMSRTREAVIQKITGFNPLKVEAHARSILMNKLTKSRLFENVRYTDVVQTIAKENGYADDQQFIDDTIDVLPSVTQAKLTDAQFLRSLATIVGFQFYVDADGLHFHPRKMGQRPTRTFTYFIDPNQGDIVSISVENDVTAKPGAVTAKGRDPLEKKDIEATANNESTKRDALAPVLEVVDAKTGETSLQNNTAAETTVQTNATSAAAAQKEADGRYVQSTQTTVKLGMSCIGDPSVEAKQVVEIQNISRRLSGRYYISGAKHKVSASDYLMDLKCRTDGTGGVGSGSSQNPQTDGKVNTQDPSDPNALKPQEVVDPKTGETTLKYVK